MPEGHLNKSKRLHQLDDICLLRHCLSRYFNAELLSILFATLEPPWKIVQAALSDIAGPRRMEKVRFVDMSKVLVRIYLLNFEQPRRHVRVEVIVIEQCQK